VISFDDLKTLYAAARGQKGWRERATLEAAHNLVGYGLSHLVLDEVSFGETPFEDEAAVAVLADLSQEPAAGVSGSPAIAIALVILRPLAKWALKKILENL
jgi:hypothetical protein